MNQSHLFKIFSTRFDQDQAEELVKELVTLKSQNIERLKEVFATKTELYEM